MNKYKKIIILNNVVEAKWIEGLLADRNIPFLIRSYGDSVYDGVFQVQSGWGYLESAVEYEQEILSIFNESKLSEQE